MVEFITSNRWKGFACSLVLTLGLLQLFGCKQVPDFLTTQQRAEQGSAVDQLTLGVMYYKGNRVEQNTQQAVAWFRKAAEQGIAQAQFNLGVMYEKGNGVEQNAQQAVAWYRKAAEQGYAQAQYNLGSMYERGNGVEQNAQQAVAWYRKAA